MADEIDPLKDAFEELRTSVLPSMRPPGVAAATRTVRRRRVMRARVAALSVVVVAGATVVLLRLPMAGSTASGTAGGVGGPPGLMPAPAPSQVFASVTWSPPARSSRLGGTTASSPLSRKAGAPRSTPTCASDGIGAFGGVNGDSVVVAWAAFGGINSKPPCAGVEVPVFWAVYLVQPDGSGAIYSSNIGYLTKKQTSLTVSPELPVDCAVVFVGHDSYANPSTLSVDELGVSSWGTGGPFWDQKHGENGVVYRGTYNCPAPPPSDSPSATGTPTATSTP